MALLACAATAAVTPTPGYILAVRTGNQGMDGIAYREALRLLKTRYLIVEKGDQNTLGTVELAFEATPAPPPEFRTQGVFNPGWYSEHAAYKDFNTKANLNRRSIAQILAAGLHHISFRVTNARNEVEHAAKQDMQTSGAVMQMGVPPAEAMKMQVQMALRGVVPTPGLRPLK